MLFRNDNAAAWCRELMSVVEELVVEALAAGTSTDGVAELYDEILDDYVQCRGRECGTCNGVACEESVDVDMTVAPKAKAIWEAADVPPSERIHAAWHYDEIGGCHL